MKDIDNIQLELLQATVNRVYKRVPFYKRQMDELDITPDDIKTLDDIRKLPFTTRDAFSKNYPYDLFAVPLRDIVRIHSLRGIDGTPVVIGYTRQDVGHRVEISKRFLTSCNVTRDDIVQICLDTGMSIAAHELKEGAEAIGALVIPPDPISLNAQIRIMIDFKTTTLISTPSYASLMLSCLKRELSSAAAISLKRIIVVGEAIDTRIRARWMEEFSVDTRAGYGISEVMGQGMAYECEAMNGLHLASDYFIAEIIDPETNQPLGHGEEGELAVTTLTNRANPLIRFKTGDVTRIIRGECPCGNPHVRIAPIQKRVDDIISIRGVKLSARTISWFLNEQLGSAPKFCLSISKDDPIERLELKIAISSEFFSGSLPELHHWLHRLEDAFQEKIGIQCAIIPTEERAIEEFHNNQVICH